MKRIFYSLFILLLVTGVGLALTSCSSDDEDNQEDINSNCYSGVIYMYNPELGLALVGIESVPIEAPFDDIKKGNGVVIILPEGTSSAYHKGDVLDFQIISREKEPTQGWLAIYPSARYRCVVKLCGTNDY